MAILRDNERCYVCGKANAIGLKLDFTIDRDTRSISGWFTPISEHQGFEGIVHGGILSAILDEAMAKLAFGLGIPAMTAELTVTFMASAAPGDELSIAGSITKETKRLVLAEARIKRGPVLIAEAKGKLLRSGS